MWKQGAPLAGSTKRLCLVSDKQKLAKLPGGESMQLWRSINCLFRWGYGRKSSGRRTNFIADRQQLLSIVVRR